MNRVKDVQGNNWGMRFKPLLKLDSKKKQQIIVHLDNFSKTEQLIHFARSFVSQETDFTSSYISHTVTSVGFRKHAAHTRPPSVAQLVLKYICQKAAVVVNCSSEL